MPNEKVFRQSRWHAEQTQKIIGSVPKQHPFEARYNQISNVKWETCSEVLNAIDRKQHLLKAWAV